MKVHRCTITRLRTETSTDDHLALPSSWNLKAGKPGVYWCSTVPQSRSEMDLEFLSEEAVIAFQCQEGLCYTIECGEVKSSTRLSMLEVGIFTQAQSMDNYDSTLPSGYIQVNDYFYPIIVGHSSVYCGFIGNECLFLFKSCENEDAIVALSLPPKTIAAFAEVLNPMNLLKVVMLAKQQETDISTALRQPEGSVSHSAVRISRGLVNGALTFSSITARGANLCQTALKKIGQKAVANVGNVERPTQPLQYKKLRKTMYCASVASKSIASLTTTIVKHTSNASAKLLNALVLKGKSSTIVKRIPAKWKDNAVLLGSSALASSSIAIHGLENAVCTVGKTAVDVAGDVIRARHGIEMGKAATDALSTVKSSALVWHNLSNFTIRNFAEKGAQLALSCEKSGQGINIGDRIIITQ